MLAPFRFLLRPLIPSLLLALGASNVTADILLSEVMTSNLDTLLDEDGESPDWIELHNDGAEAVDLGGYFLTDNRDDLNKWELPAVDLAAGGYLVIFASGKDRGGAGAELHTNFQLKNGGEFLALVDPDKTTILDQFDPEIPQLEEGESYGVRASGDLWVLNFFSSPTPNEANGSGTVAEEVEFSVSGQAYTDSLELTLSTRSGSPITYTTDGTKPTLFKPGIAYTSPLTLTESTVISAQISGGPLSQEVYFRVTPELAMASSDLPLVILQSPGTIGTSYDEMLLAIKEPSEEDARTQIRTDEPFDLTGIGQIRTRGSSTQSFPKKSYRLEFQDGEGDDLVKKPFDMPAESDWIITGRYGDDRALVRNEFIYQLSRDIGRYAARSRYCEVYVSEGDGPVSVDDYVGVYSFMEAIKRDADRIDIEELGEDQNSEPEITGGYIFKVDRSGPNDTQTTGGGQNIVITEPSASELTSAQLAYLRGYLNDMRASFDSTDPETGYPAFIDVPAWIDHHLLNMLMLNIDSLRLSTFFYKDRNGPVVAGPIWDFNISSGSDDRFGNPPRATNPEVWRGISADRGTTFFENGTQQWWGDLFDDRDFQQQYCDRWHELRANEFSNEYITTLIDSLAEEIREAQMRNEARWPGAPPEHGGWQGEIDHLKDWLTTRADWVDNELVRPPTATPSSGALADGDTVRLRGNRGTLFSPTQLYYTTDGSDPRLPGGGISDAAIEYTEPFSLTASATLTVREFMPTYNPKPDGPDQQWSAPASLSFIVGGEPAAAGNLVVSELMYHPSNPTEAEIAAGFTNDDDFEYIEFTNIGASPIDLLGLEATDGLSLKLADSLVLAPNGSVVFVSNLEAFRERYGEAVPVAGVYGGSLANSGDSLAFAGATGEPILAFSYDDNAPWPTEADGDGVSLELVGIAANPDPNEPTNWALSVSGGTPGTTGGDPPVGQTYEEWAATAITGGAAAARTDDPDGDGLVNLVEFATGTDPVVAHDLEPITVSEDADGISVSYRVQAGTTGVSTTLQTSADLVSWADFTGAVTNEPGKVTARLSEGAGGHVRLKVE